MTQYAGNSALFPANFSLVDDTSPPVAAYVNVALEALGDRTANVNARLIDGLNGGSYDPANPIVLTFEDLELTVEGTGGANIPWMTLAPGDFITAPGYLWTFSGGLSVPGTATIVTGNVTALTVTNTLTIPGVATAFPGANAGWTWSGPQQTRVVTAEVGSGAFVAIGVVFDQYIDLNSGSARTVQIASAPAVGIAVPGNVVRYTCAPNTGGAVTITRSTDGATICSFPASTTVGGWAEFTFTHDNHWVCTAWSSNATSVVVG